MVGADGVAEAGMSGVAVARGRASVGKKGICVARGENARVRGGVGAVLVIADEHGKCKVAIVDGEKIKADTWYKMSFGELQEDV